MKCVKCKKENEYIANYCKKCGNKFSEEEQKKAKKWTLVWWLEGIDKIKSLWKFSFITDNIIFKTLSVLLVLGVGIYSFFLNGVNLKILASDDYNLQYNTKLKEYYLLVKDSNTKLNLYIPEKTKKLIVKHLNKDNKVIEKIDYKKDAKITLENNAFQDYYIIEGKYKNNKSDSLKIFVYRKKEANHD